MSIPEEHLSTAAGPEAPASVPAPGGERPWGLWRRQVAAILRLELKKTLLSRRSLLLYLMAALPVAALVLFGVLPTEWRPDPTLGFATTVYAGVYQTFLLRFILFFGCVWVFTNLFRGEVLDRSLHYYFLAPVRRQVLVVGKFLAALVTTVVLFAGSTLLSYLALYLPYGLSGIRDHLLAGPGLGQLAAYLAVTALACLGYGALFLLAGLLFKNPVLPAAGLLIWEGINFLLPPLLKKLSVIHYLKGLLPVAISEGPFAVVVEPPPTWVSVGGLLVFTALVLAASGWRIRSMEIDYAEE